MPSLLNKAIAAATPKTISVESASELPTAIRSASSGDTIKPAAGSYNAANIDVAVSGLTIDGANGVTFIAPDKAFAFKIGGGRGVRFVNCKFDGGALFTDGKVKDVYFDGCDFTRFNRGSDNGLPTGGAIGGGGGDGNNVRFTNCSVHDAPGAVFFNMWRIDNLYINDNAFVNVAGSIKSNNSGSTCSNQHIERNYFAQNSRHAVELQGCVNGFWFTDNYYEKPVLSSDFHANDSTFAFSLIYTAASSDQHILRNYINTTERPDGTGVRIGFEAGEFCEIRDNVIIGTGTPATIYGPGSVMENNLVFGALYPSYIYGPGRGLTPSIISTVSNNPNVKPTWNVNRAKPGPGKSAALEVTKPITIDMTITATGNDTFTVAWPAVASATSYSLSVRTTHGGDKFIDIGNVTSPIAYIAGLHGGWEYDVQVSAVGAPAAGIESSYTQGGQAAAEASGPSNASKLVSSPPSGPATQPTTQPADDSLLDYDVLLPIRKGLLQSATTRKAS